ncbi:indole-3-glycerol phosphate synthase TrpC [Enterococcus cecorum]|uniref:indole-3-glycerol phosphate synthase TrpC n=1 Tax=Enterococcus cecorum TaxID=44008 RepID=UPI002009E1DD|nr:indole-3-glycerol phosphate synthase TrpC [Enterococcus cecorum]
MTDILQTIATKTKERIEKQKILYPLEELKQACAQLPINQDFPFEQALRKEGLSYICECKKASPSKGLIDEDFNYLQIAKEYEKVGARAISVLTEPEFFLGSDQYLQEIAQEVKIPCLRKDFVVDEYMIYQAKLLGAQAILLIVSLLDTQTLKQYLDLATSLGLSCLVEAHDEAEIKQAIDAGAKMIGVNNRNLRNFQVNVENTLNLRRAIPKEILMVAESGIQNRSDIALLEKAQIDAVLIGETLMKASDRQAKMAELRGEQDE